MIMYKNRCSLSIAIKLLQNPLEILPLLIDHMNCARIDHISTFSPFILLVLLRGVNGVSVCVAVSWN